MTARRLPLPCSLSLHLHLYSPDEGLCSSRHPDRLWTKILCPRIREREGGCLLKVSLYLVQLQLVLCNSLRRCYGILQTRTIRSCPVAIYRVWFQKSTSRLTVPSCWVSIRFRVCPSCWVSTRSRVCSSCCSRPVFRQSGWRLHFMSALLKPVVSSFDLNAFAIRYALAPNG